MNSSPDNAMNQLQHFYGAVAEKYGAVVDAIDPEGLEVLAPPPLQQALRLPEWARLGFGAELPPQAQRVSLDTDLLERLEGLLGEHGRYVRRVLVPDNPPPGHPERVLEHTLELPNAVYRLRDVAPTWTRYLILRFRYTAISDEKRDGILDFGVNLANGATLDGMLPALLSAAELQSSSPTMALPALPAPAWPRDFLPTLLARALPPRLDRQLESFLAGMTRRQERDLQRLYAYHHDLQREAATRLAALAARETLSDKQQAEQTRERQRLEAIVREYQTKVTDVRQKYAMKVEVAWLQTLELAMPVQRFTVLIKRRKGEREFALDWNPLVRQLESPPCEYSYTAERPREVCDAALHLVSPAAHGPCPACGKAYCRACHPAACPKCGCASSRGA
jgi:hypothetical protein